MKNHFDKPRCAGCGEPLAAQRATYNTPTIRIYCEQCRPVGDLKENWKPFTSGSSISAIYTLDENGRPVRKSIS